MSRAESTAGGVVVRTRSAPLAGALAWIVPGLGHWYLGHRRRALVFFVTIVATFWGGVALGGVKNTVNIPENGAWFAAQLCAGTQTLAALMWSKSTPGLLAYQSIYPASDLAVVYTSIAGLLNLLVIVDVLVRSEARAQAGGAARASPRGPAP